MKSLQIRQYLPTTAADTYSSRELLNVHLAELSSARQMGLSSAMPCAGKRQTTLTSPVLSDCWGWAESSQKLLRILAKVAAFWRAAVTNSWAGNPVSYSCRRGRQYKPCSPVPWQLTILLLKRLHFESCTWRSHCTCFTISSFLPLFTLSLLQFAAPVG